MFSMGIASIPACSAYANSDPEDDGQEEVDKVCGTSVEECPSNKSAYTDQGSEEQSPQRREESKADR